MKHDTHIYALSLDDLVAYHFNVPASRSPFKVNDKYNISIKAVAGAFVSLKHNPSFICIVPLMVSVLECNAMIW